MNFFRRRKILKRMNSLDLTPVRLMEHAVRDDGNVSILLPRFQNRFSSALFQPSRKARLIPIRLDMTGSAIWLLIDGQRIVGEICRIMQEQHPEKMQPPSETEKRITEFLALLYRERYITFREISDKD